MVAPQAYNAPMAHLATGLAEEQVSPPVLEVEDLYVSFAGYRGRTRAVNGVSFQIRRGEILGIVGESGCGKSVTAMSLLKLIPMPPGQIDGGAIRLNTRGGVVDIAALPANGREIREIRGREISMIFQEPMRSLHPMFSIGDQIVEILLQHFSMERKAALEKAIALLDRVGLPEPHRIARDYPHQLSGGMRQRAMIAIALACEPQLLIADEPTTALDVTVQAQILELIQELQAEMGLAVMLITHDMGIIAETADRVMVMYLGEVVESASVAQLFENPQHPYTQGLLRAIPNLVDLPKTPLYSMEGSVPELLALPSYCVFADRCQFAHTVPAQHKPPVIETAPGHLVKCWLYDERYQNG
jgi:oligopeptide/dipeptide ABC transporter ATP-binding protein